MGDDGSRFKQVQHVTDTPEENPFEEVLKQYIQLVGAGLTPDYVKVGMMFEHRLRGCVEYRITNDTYYTDDYMRVNEQKKELNLGRGNTIPVVSGDVLGVKVVAEEHSETPQ